jgi:O-acetyl-ADP-ribose deacetylase (regulator of RNase III)
MLSIVLTAIDEPLARAWSDATRDLPFVETHLGSIFETGADALVSPANAFGFMDGGIDMLYSQRFGWDLQERLQARIRSAHHGELLVGAAEIVPTFGVPSFLIAAPTMRVPMILPEDTIAPYLAARAVLLLVKHGRLPDGAPVSDVVSRVAFPGLGTGIGRVPPERCARQVRAAIDDVLLEASPFPRSWDDAQERHQRLYGDVVRDLQLEDGDR